MKNLYDEIVKILNLKNKTLDDVETIVLIDDIDTKKAAPYLRKILYVWQEKLIMKTA